MWVISIHAPPRGATTLVLASRLATLFQFTPLREGRRTQQPLMWMKKLISIHAPPRGATARASSRQQKRQHFNSRPSARGDNAPERRGGTQLPDFNSRPSARGDQANLAAIQKCLISIHAPPRGATPAGQPTSTISHFNSRPSARGDRRGRNLRVDFPISIHAPPRGATPHAGEPRSRRSISIHAPPRGATTFAG